MSKRHGVRNERTCVRGDVGAGPPRSHRVAADLDRGWPRAALLRAREALEKAQGRRPISNEGNTRDCARSTSITPNRCHRRHRVRIFVRNLRQEVPREALQPGPGVQHSALLPALRRARGTKLEGFVAGSRRLRDDEAGDDARERGQGERCHRQGRRDRAARTALPRRGSEVPPRGGALRQERLRIVPSGRQGAREVGGELGGGGEPGGPRSGPGRLLLRGRGTAPGAPPVHPRRVHGWPPRALLSASHVAADPRPPGRHRGRVPRAHGRRRCG